MMATTISSSIKEKPRCLRIGSWISGTYGFGLGLSKLISGESICWAESGSRESYQRFDLSLLFHGFSEKPMLNEMGRAGGVLTNFGSRLRRIDKLRSDVLCVLLKENGQRTRVRCPISSYPLSGYLQLASSRSATGPGKRRSHQPEKWCRQAADESRRHQTRNTTWCLSAR
jgi:hypothetical protein